MRLSSASSPVRIAWASFELGAMNRMLAHFTHVGCPNPIAPEYGHDTTLTRA